MSSNGTNNLIMSAHPALDPAQQGPTAFARSVLPRLLDHLDAPAERVDAPALATTQRLCGQWLVGQMCAEDLTLRQLASAAGIPVATLYVVVVGVAEPDELLPSQRRQLASALCRPAQQDYAERIIAAACGREPLTEAEAAHLRAELARWYPADLAEAIDRYAAEAEAGWEPEAAPAGADARPAAVDAAHGPARCPDLRHLHAGAGPPESALPVGMGRLIPSATLPLTPASVTLEPTGTVRRSRIVPLRMALHGLVLVLLVLVLIAEPVWQTLAGLPLPMQVVAAASAPLSTGAEGLVLYAAPPGTGAAATVWYASSIELPTSGSDALAFAQPTTRIAVGPDGVITRTAYAADGQVVAVRLEQAGLPLVIRTYARTAQTALVITDRVPSATQELGNAHSDRATPLSSSRLITIDPQQAQVAITDGSGAVRLDRTQGWVLDPEGRLQSDGVYRYTHTDAGPQITWHGVLVAGAGSGRGLWADILREHPPQIALLGNRVATPATATVWDGTQWIQIATGWYIAETDAVADWHVDPLGQVVGVRDAAGTVAPVRLAAADESTAATVATWAITQRLGWLPFVVYHVVNSTEWLLVHQTSLLVGAVFLVVMSLALPLVRRGYYCVQGRAVPVLVVSVRTQRG